MLGCPDPFSFFSRDRLVQTHCKMNGDQNNFFPSSGVQYKKEP